MMRTSDNGPAFCLKVFFWSTILQKTIDYRHIQLILFFLLSYGQNCWKFTIFAMNPFKRSPVKILKNTQNTRQLTSIYYHFYYLKLLGRKIIDCIWANFNFVFAILINQINLSSTTHILLILLLYPPCKINSKNIRLQR